MEVPHNLRVCVRCGESKSRSAFSKVAKGRDGLHSYCRACMTRYMGARRQHVVHDPRPCEWCQTEFTPKDVRGRFCSNNCKVRARYWRENPREDRRCPVCDADITSMRREAIYCSPACREKQRRRDGRVTKADERNRTLKRYHRLTLDDYERMAAEQGHRCAICRTDDPGTPHGYWHIDHDHSCRPARSKGCGECVRGLLCGPCNLGLGHFKDDPERLKAAVDYLTR